VATVECDQRAVRITENAWVANASSFGYTSTDPTDP
jgi:hypothetical protein